MEIDSNLLQVPEDSASLRALVQQLLLERDHEKQRAQELKQHADEQQRRAEEHQRRVDQQIKQTEQLQVELLRVKLELDRYKKWYYGPRADWLQSDQDVAQMLLNFAEELDCKPVPAEDLAAAAEPAEELRRVKRRRGRRNLANFENLSVSTQVYELSEAERACPCCGLTRKEIGAMKAGRWSICQATSNASSMCARSMPAQAARRTAKTPASKRRKGRRRPSTKGLPVQACWPIS